LAKTSTLWRPPSPTPMFADDINDVHPNGGGHRLIAQLFIHFFERELATPAAARAATMAATLRKRGRGKNKERRNVNVVRSPRPSTFDRDTGGVRVQSSTSQSGSSSSASGSRQCVTRMQDWCTATIDDTMEQLVPSSSSSSSDSHSTSHMSATFSPLSSSQSTALLSSSSSPLADTHFPRLVTGWTYVVEGSAVNPKPGRFNHASRFCQLLLALPCFCY
jgi:hypothetical protein